MDPKLYSKQRGLRMAMRAAALSVGAGATLLSLTTGDATAADEPIPQPAAETPSPVEAARIHPWSCRAPSRGPLAPPCVDADVLAALADEVPW